MNWVKPTMVRPKQADLFTQLLQLIHDPVIAKRKREREKERKREREKE